MKKNSPVLLVPPESKVDYRQLMKKRKVLVTNGTLGVCQPPKKLDLKAMKDAGATQKEMIKALQARHPVGKRKPTHEDARTILINCGLITPRGRKNTSGEQI